MVPVNSVQSEPLTLLFAPLVGVGARIERGIAEEVTRYFELRLVGRCDGTEREFGRFRSCRCFVAGDTFDCVPVGGANGRQVEFIDEISLFQIRGRHYFAFGIACHTVDAVGGVGRAAVNT